MISIRFSFWVIGPFDTTDNYVKIRLYEMRVAGGTARHNKMLVDALKTSI